MRERRLMWSNFAVNGARAARANEVRRAINAREMLRECAREGGPEAQRAAEKWRRHLSEARNWARWFRATEKSERRAAQP